MKQYPVTADSPVLELKEISVALGGQKVLDVPSLQILPHKVLVIIGHNGSGKTTLLLTLALLQKPTAGTVLFQGNTVHYDSSILHMRRRLAVVFQEPLLLNTSVWDNVTLGLRLRGVNHQETDERAQRWLERFGIGELAKRQARTLSGGEAQRASLARAFALQPEVLFLDEPFAALDRPTRESLIGDIENILKETRITTVMVTHDRNEALTLGNNVAVLMHGKIEQIGKPREVFSRPVNEEVARFVGVENLLKGEIIANQDGKVDVKVNGHIIEGISRSCAGDEVHVFIRPEDITLSLARSSSSARNVFPGKVSLLQPSGPITRVTVDCGFPLIVLITKMSADEMNLEIDKSVFVSFKATAIHITGAKSA